MDMVLLEKTLIYLQSFTTFLPNTFTFTTESYMGFGQVRVNKYSVFIIICSLAYKFKKDVKFTTGLVKHYIHS